MKLFGLIKAAKLLVDIRKGWTSKGVVLARVGVLLSGIDSAWFGGELGQSVIHGVEKLLGFIPFLPPVTDAQATDVCLFILAGILQWIRVHTTEPVDGK